MLCPFLCAQVFADQRQFLRIRKFKDDETAEIRVHATIYRRGNGSPERLSDSVTQRAAAELVPEAPSLSPWSSVIMVLSSGEDFT